MARGGPRPGAHGARPRAAGADRVRPQGPSPGRAVGDALRVVGDEVRGMTAVPEPGTSFAGYQVEAVIGRGGMGVVYRATDLSLGRPVALKLIAPEVAQNARFRRRFLNEPRLAASLDHPSVIPIYEAGETRGQLFLAMRYVEGCDL